MDVVAGPVERVDDPAEIAVGADVRESLFSQQAVVGEAFAQQFRDGVLAFKIRLGDHVPSAFLGHGEPILPRKQNLSGTASGLDSRLESSVQTRLQEVRFRHISLRFENRLLRRF